MSSYQAPRPCIRAALNLVPPCYWTLTTQVTAAKGMALQRRLRCRCGMVPPKLAVAPCHSCTLCAQDAAEPSTKSRRAM
jgi:hypothetical protein